MNNTLPFKPDNKTTPMMEQYLRIKHEHPDTLLFYRMGDFYELFFADAIAAAAALDIALTHRGKHLGKDIPMCGVPVHAADAYLGRLIRKGFRVTVCEQTGEPFVSAKKDSKKRAGKSVINRKVVRIITPGTLTEDNLLDARSHNFLVSLAYSDKPDKSEEPDNICALAWADVSTGLFYTRLLPVDELPLELARLTPKELLLPEHAMNLDAVQTLEAEHKGTLTPLPQRDFDPHTGKQRLLRLLAIVSLEAVGDYRPLELAACGALVGYVETTQVGRLPSLEAPRRQTRQTNMSIDPATRRNLELTHSIAGDRKHSLLGVIDRTITAPGARLLREYLNAPLLDTAAIQRRLDAVACFHAAPSLRARLRAMLRHIPDMARALARLSVQRGGPRDLAALRDGLRTAHALREQLHSASADTEFTPAEATDTPLLAPSQTPPDQPALPSELERITRDIGSDAAALEQHLRRALVPEPPLLLRDGGMVVKGYDAPLDDTNRLHNESRQVIASLQQRYARETGITSLKIRHNFILGYHIETSSNHANRLMQEPFNRTFLHRQTMASSVRFSTAELAELAERILRAEDRAKEREKQIFDHLCSEALTLSATLKRIATAVARLDVFTALGELAESNEYVRPQVDSSLLFDIRGGRHPIVEAALTTTGFTANDCILGLPPVSEQETDTPQNTANTIDNNASPLCIPGKRIWLLTGPNMAGKSTFLRQNALIAILAQMGSFVPARSAHIGIVDRVFSRVGAADDLAGGRSTFMVEMIETAAILNQAGPAALVILDEIGRGTATFDGLAIAWAVVEYLHDINGARAIFATHYHELTELRERLEALETVTLRSQEWQGDIVFLHEIARGSADGSYGVQVARLAGLPASVISRAREKLALLETTGRQQRDNLFASPTPPSAKTPSPPEHPALVELRNITPDNLSPRQALDMLYHLQSRFSPPNKNNP